MRSGCGKGDSQVLVGGRSDAVVNGPHRLAATDARKKKLVLHDLRLARGAYDHGRSGLRGDIVAERCVACATSYADHSGRCGGPLVEVWLVLCGGIVAIRIAVRRVPFDGLPVCIVQGRALHFTDRERGLELLPLVRVDCEQA